MNMGNCYEKGEDNLVGIVLYQKMVKTIGFGMTLIVKRDIL